jgi:hypothetical protein
MGKEVEEGRRWRPKKRNTNLHLFDLAMIFEVFFPFKLYICFQDFVLGFGSDEFAWKVVSTTNRSK